MIHSKNSRQLLKTAEEKKVLDFLNQFPALAIACSGGVDSVVLAHWLALKKRSVGLQSSLALFHVHHGQHHKADLMVQHIHKLSQILKIPAFIAYLDSTPGASEDALREKRRKAFLKLWTQWGKTEAIAKTPHILTAHHSEDQLETYLFKLMRGSHPESIRAMASASESDDIFWVRPLVLSGLQITKQAIFKYAEQNQFEWIEDPTNSQTQYARNAIRHRLIPLLEELRPQSSLKILKFFEELQSRNHDKKNEQDFELLKEKLLSQTPIPLNEISFEPLQKCLEQIMGKACKSLKKTHWDRLKKLLLSGKISGEEKIAQFPEGHCIILHRKTLRYLRTST